MATGIPARLTPAEGRKFAFTVGAAFVALGALLWWRDKETAAAVVAGLGGALLLAGVVVPGSLGPVQRTWMRFALVLSKVTTPIFMGIVYFIVLTPVGVVRQLMGRNPLTSPAGARTRWVPRDPSRAGSMERQF